MKKLNKYLNYLLYTPNPWLLTVNLITGIATSVVMTINESYELHKNFIER